MLTCRDQLSESAERDSAAIIKQDQEFLILLEEDIQTLYKTDEERERVREILRQAQAETERAEVNWDARPDSLKRFLARWHVRFKYGIHWRKPLYPLRVIRNYVLEYFYALFSKKKHIFRGIEFALTFRCNFKCHHCLCIHIDETETRAEMTPDEYRKVVDQAMAMGATTFGMEGGEPYVNKNWEEIVKAWYPKYNHVIVSTNGFNMNEDVVLRSRDIGIDTANISLDSGIPELHDLFRRKRGSFERVMRAVDLCEKYGIKVILNTVIHRGNLYTEGLRKIFEFADRRKIMVNALFAKGVGDFRDKNAMLTDEDFKAFEKIVAPYNYWSIHHAGALGSSCGDEGCPATKEFVNMTPYGDVMNCANNHIYFGNVRDESLADIRQRAMTETPFGEYRPCFLTQDKDFMNVYYPLLNTKKLGEAHITIDEFRAALRDYEKKKGVQVYPELS